MATYPPTDNPHTDPDTVSRPRLQNHSTSPTISRWWRRLGEAIAVLGVILSLIFVGVQIRQNAVVASSQAVQELATMSQDFLLTIATDSDAHRIFTATFFRPGDVTELEQIRATYIMIAFVRRTESAFAQVQRGLLAENALDAYGMAEIVGLLQRVDNPRFRSFWSMRRNTMNPSFVKYVEERSQYQPPPPVP